MTDADLERNGYIYTVTGPDGVVYNTLAEAMAANQTLDTTSNGASQTDSSPQMFTVNYEQRTRYHCLRPSLFREANDYQNPLLLLLLSQKVFSFLNQFQKVSHYPNQYIDDSESISTSISASFSVSDSRATHVIVYF